MSDNCFDGTWLAAVALNCTVNRLSEIGISDKIFKCLSKISGMHVNSFDSIMSGMHVNSFYSKMSGMHVNRFDSKMSGMHVDRFDSKMSGMHVNMTKRK